MYVIVFGLLVLRGGSYKSFSGPGFCSSRKGRALLKVMREFCRIRAMNEENRTKLCGEFFAAKRDIRLVSCCAKN